MAAFFKKRTVSTETESASALLAEPARAVTPTGVDKKIVAAIMAAICVSTGKAPKELHFRAIRHDLGMRNPWSSDGTAQIIHERQQYL